MWSLPVRSDHKSSVTPMPHRIEANGKAVPPFSTQELFPAVQIEHKLELRKGTVRVFGGRSHVDEVMRGMQGTHDEAAIA